MDIKDIFSIATAILASIGGGAAIVLALSNWLGKIWANRILSVEKHRFEKEIESIRAEFKIHELQSQVRFSKLHEERLEKIKELHSMLVDMEGMINSVSILYTLHKGDKNRDPFSRDQAQDIRELASKFLGFWNRNRLFFSDDLCDSLKTLSWMSASFGQNYLHYVVDGNMNNVSAEQEVEEWLRVREELPGFIHQVESEFKKLLGVESSQKT